MGRNASLNQNSGTHPTPNSAKEGNSEVRNYEIGHMMWSELVTIWIYRIDFFSSRGRFPNLITVLQNIVEFRKKIPNKQLKF